MMGKSSLLVAIAVLWLGPQTTFAQNKDRPKRDPSALFDRLDSAGWRLAGTPLGLACDCVLRIHDSAARTSRRATKPPAPADRYDQQHLSASDIAGPGSV